MYQQSLRFKVLARKGSECKNIFIIFLIEEQLVGNYRLVCQQVYF